MKWSTAALLADQAPGDVGDENFSPAISSPRQRRISPKCDDYAPSPSRRRDAPGEIAAAGREYLLEIACHAHLMRF